MHLREVFGSLPNDRHEFRTIRRGLQKNRVEPPPVADNEWLAGVRWTCESDGCVLSDVDQSCGGDRVPETFDRDLLRGRAATVVGKLGVSIAVIHVNQAGPKLGLLAIFSLGGAADLAGPAARIAACAPGGVRPKFEITVDVNRGRTFRTT